MSVPHVHLTKSGTVQFLGIGETAIAPLEQVHSEWSWHRPCPRRHAQRPSNDGRLRRWRRSSSSRADLAQFEVSAATSRVPCVMGLSGHRRTGCIQHHARPRHCRAPIHLEREARYGAMGEAAHQGDLPLEAGATPSSGRSVCLVIDAARSRNGVERLHIPALHYEVLAGRLWKMRARLAGECLVEAGSQVPSSDGRALGEVREASRTEIQMEATTCRALLRGPTQHPNTGEAKCLSLVTSQTERSQLRGHAPLAR